MEKPVIFKSGGQQVVGMLHLPGKSKKKVPGVVLFHGYKGNKSETHRMFIKTSRVLAEVGIASLRFDFRGQGDSEGEFSTMTIGREMRDAKAALKFIRQQPEIDPNKIGILGLSLGGMIAALIVSKDPKIKTTVLWSAVSDLGRLVKERMTSEAWRQLELMGCVDEFAWAVGKRFIDESSSFDPISALTKTKGHVLLIHGDADGNVPVQSTLDYSVALKKAKKPHFVHIIPGADHTYNSLQWEMEVLSLTLEWFRMHLLKKD